MKIALSLRLLPACVALLATGCASTSHVARYQQQDCPSLAAETRNAQRQLAEYSDWIVDSPAKTRVVDAPGFLLWPAFAFLEDQRGRDTRFDDLRDRYLALAEASANRACTMASPRPVDQHEVPRVSWRSDQG